jgi:hypothetical protein
MKGGSRVHWQIECASGVARQSGLDAFGRPRDEFAPPPKKRRQQPPGSGSRKGKALARKGLRP